MNILILFSQPWRVGGAETHVEALIKGFNGHKIFLAVNEGSNKDKLAKLIENYPNLRIVTIQARGINAWRWHSDIQTLAKLIHEENITVISAQQRTAGIWAYFLWRKTKVMYTVTMHDPWHRAKFKSIYPKIFPVIFAVSANLAANLHENFGFNRQQIKQINNGIDFSAFVPAPLAAAREKLNLAPKGKLILHVSRLSSTKGAVSLTLIESMALLLKDHSDAQLMIIGEGPLRAKIEQKIADFNKIHGNKIIIHDFVDDIINWYNACDILVGEGRVAMETLACHKPIVAIRNADRFIGTINKDNIADACDVNFDGSDQPVTTANMAAAITAALGQEYGETVQIANYIKGRLSIEKMTKAYLEAFNVRQK